MKIKSNTNVWSLSQIHSKAKIICVFFSSLVYHLLVRWEALYLPLVQLPEEVCPLWRADAPPQHAPEEPDQAAARHLSIKKEAEVEEDEEESGGERKVAG